MRIIATILLLGMYFTVHAQHLYDNQWMLGGTFDNRDSTKWNDVPILDFRADTITLKDQFFFSELDTLTFDSFLKYDFKNRVQAYSSSDGALQFATNHCSLWSFADSFYVKNGRDISDPEIGLCPGGSKSYEYHLALPIQDSVSAFSYYYLYCDRSWPPTAEGTQCNNLIRCKINQNQEGQLMVQKCSDLFSDTMYHAGLGAVKHANNRDWWIAKPMKFSTDLLLLHFDMVTGQIVDTLVHEDALPYGDVGVGQFTSVKFNAQGTQLAISDFVYGLVLHDFDRATGEISYRRDFYLPYDQDRFNPSYGSEFSSSGNYLYLANEYYLFQLDPHAADLSLDVDTIAYWQDFNNTTDITVFGSMQRGPDCRIYVSNISALVSKIHVIEYPNRKGEACGFRTDLPLLGYTVRGYASYPNYRLGTPYPVCDSAKVLPPEWRPVSNQESAIRGELDVRIYPNPASGVVQIKAQSPIDKVEVLDFQGRLVGVYERPTSIDLSHQPSGLYFLRISSREGQVTKKLILQR